MKLSLYLVTVFSICFLLCGCFSPSEISDGSTSYLVSSLGFEQDGENLTVIAETMVVNSEDSEAEKKRLLLKGVGKSVREALYNAEKKASRPLELSHSGAIILSKNISEKYFSDICDFCHNNNELTLSILFAASERASKILETEPQSTVAIGYEIMSIMEQRTSLEGIQYENRFYEIYSEREKPLNVVYIPYFSVNDEMLLLDGVLVYKNDEFKFSLDNEQVSLLSIARNNQKNGTLFIKDIPFKIRGCYSQINPKTQEKAEIEIKIKSDNEKLKNSIETEILKLFELSKKEKTDIFGIGNSFYNKKPKLWQKIEKDYYSFYENMNLTVKYNE